MLRFISWIIGVSTAFVFASCGNIKQLQYVQGDIDTVALRNINYIEPVIQKGDLLNITVYSDNKLASELYNQVAISAGAAAIGSPSAPGYLVSQDGTIQLYELGLLKVDGLSKKQVADILVKQYTDRQLLKNPFVEVRFINFKITLIGDVNSPGVKTFATEKVSIFDAVGAAGDLGPYAKRSNILIVREIDSVRHFARLDLTNPNVFSSPYYYLKQNDMVIVDPTKQKAILTDQTFRNISIATSILSIVAIVYSFFRR